MKALAVIMGLIGLAVLPSSFGLGLGLLMLAAAAGLWAAGSSRKAQKPSLPRPAERPSQRITAPTARATPRPAPSAPAPLAADLQWLGPGERVIVHGHS